tara:strand:+ start:72 stop:401 length:330 start_codon:yes stop_codon:yes gene_type:complete
MSKLLKVLGTKEAIDSIVLDSKEEFYLHEVFGYKPEIITAATYDNNGDVLQEAVYTGMYQLDFNFRGLEADDDGNYEIPVNLYGATIVDRNTEGNTVVLGYSYSENNII